MSEQLGPPAGWYPDPEMAATTRYWDGRGWTDHRAPAALSPTSSIAAPSVDRPERPDRTVAYVVAVVLPIVGIIYGLTKLKDGGTNIIAVSLGAWMVWMLIFL